MTKARFYIKDKVQEVGYRVHISPYRACGVVGQSPTMQKILNSDLKGNVINSMRSSQALNIVGGELVWV